MDTALLAELERGLCGLSFPADKDELTEHLAAEEADEAACWLARAMPGRWFQFGSDVLSTARIALELGIRQPWPERARPRAGFATDATLADEVRQRLSLCRGTNSRLVRVHVEQGTVYLDGRAADVPQGVMATRVAGGVVPGWRVVNRLEIAS